MPDDNVEIVRRCCEAFDRGDYAAALDALDPQIEYDLTHFPEGKVYRGRGGAQQAFRIWMGTLEDYRQEREELIEGANGEVVVLRASTDASREAAWRFLEIHTESGRYATGKAVRVRFYSTMAEALEAVGPSA